MGWGCGPAVSLPPPPVSERELLVPLPQPLQGSAETQAVADSWNHAASPGETAPSWDDQSLCSESWRPGACRSYNSSISGGAGCQRENVPRAAGGTQQNAILIYFSGVLKK